MVLDLLRFIYSYPQCLPMTSKTNVLWWLKDKERKYDVGTLMYPRAGVEDTMIVFSCVKLFSTSRRVIETAAGKSEGLLYLKCTLIIKAWTSDWLVTYAAFTRKAAKGAYVDCSPLCSCHNCVHHLDDSVQSRVSANCHVSSTEVVIDRADHPHNVKGRVLLDGIGLNQTWKEKKLRAGLGFCLSNHSESQLFLQTQISDITGRRYGFSVWHQMTPSSTCCAELFSTV